LREYTNDTMVALLEERGFLEDNTFINMKILCGVGCTVIALLSQFWKSHEEEKLLDHKPWQMFCVAVYTVFMSGYYYIDYFLAKDTFFMCNGHEVSTIFLLIPYIFISLLSFCC